MKSLAVILLGLCLVVPLLVMPAVAIAQPESRDTKTKSLALNAMARERKARVYAQKANWDQVIKILSSYADEISYNGLMDLATAYRNKSDFKSEIRILEIAIAERPDQYLAYFLQGRSYKAAGNNEQAIARFRHVISAQPKHEPSYHEILEIFLEQKDTYESRNIVNDMIKKLGAKPIFYTHLCHLYTMDAFLNEAEKNCRMAVRMAPEVEQNYVDLGQVQVDLKDFESARKTYASAAKKFPKSEPVLWAAGNFFFQQKNHRTASRHLKQALVTDSKSTRSHLVLAQSQFALAHYDEALKHFEPACKEDKNAGKLFRQAAAQLQNDGNLKWAREFSARLYLCQ